ncbi:TPA: formate hydrogenlyase transcriptional activator FlhA [Klebsiella pneumoniae]|nr:formate hydrogenlyase transcriptional activator FlhA [Klebsiella pneumoniae]HBU0891082.1 formate hydrogenlyase transcriptional activator FlhA [Klebsiella pneumoniae]
MKSVQLAHGSGGQAMQQLIGDLFMQAFANPWLAEQEDQARLDLAALAAQGDRLAFSTDSYVIDPLFFPGGNIGKLAVCGTANDVAVSGAIPRYLSCGFILEEGLEMATLEAVVASMADTARAAGIAIVTGDTKVVPRGAADKLFINTAGIGAIPADVHWGTQQISAGDVLLVSGTLGDHGATILNLREQMGLDGALSSDCAVLTPLIQTLRPLSGVKALRDATRGGVNAVAHEFAAASGCGIELQEATLPVNDTVRGVCELLGLDALHCDHETFADTWPQLIRSGLYHPFGYYSLLPLAADGRIFGGCEFLRRDNRPWSEKEFQRLHTFAQIVAVVTEQIQNRVSNNVDYDLLCHERDNFRILVAITNAVLSRLDIDELVSEVAKEIHRYFRIDAISVVLRSDRKGKLNIYSTHYLDASHPVHDQSEVDEAGTLTERVFKSKEMLLLNLHEHDTLAPYEKMLFEMWGNKIQTLCLLPLMSGNTLLGVLKLAQCDEQVFTTTNLKLLRQIAERVSIAIDNALAYREIQRLKERLVDENLALTEQLNNVESEFGEIIGRSEAMNNVLKQVEMVAQSDSTVLILGETGTGKELIARAIHNLSGRNGRRMVKMNCAAMPAGLLESDLFGHERGAFTGASAQRIGRFELADKSSLFLDEVGDMPLELQPKLLRVLQEQEFERLGSNKLIQTDVRLIAATNRDLKQMVIDREFRSDLYYRLNVFPIHLPPLRERPDDIPLLVKAFTFKIARRMGRNIDSIPAETLRTLTRMEWPGNVRELENVIERAVLLTRGNVLQLSLPERDIVEAPRTPAVLPEEGEDEYQLIVRVLKESNGVVAGPKGAAQRLGLKRTTLLSRMKRLGINKDELV